MILNLGVKSLDLENDDLKVTSESDLWENPKPSKLEPKKCEGWTARLRDCARFPVIIVA
jgi:hypothetical protein